jgi:hypothetical protein
LTRQFDQREYDDPVFLSKSAELHEKKRVEFSRNAKSDKRARKNKEVKEIDEVEEVKEWRAWRMGRLGGSGVENSRLTIT